MWVANEWKDYEVLDTSEGEKLERWGDFLLVRPDPQVIWNTPKSHKVGRLKMHTITAVIKEAANGNFSICQNNGLFFIKA